MQKLEVKANENGKYIEYKGVVLAFEHIVPIRTENMIFLT